MFGHMPKGGNSPEIAHRSQTNLEERS